MAFEVHAGEINGRFHFFMRITLWTEVIEHSYVLSVRSLVLAQVKKY
jgi:hypothetical protein